MSNKIAFGIGMFANQMFPAILGIFMVVLIQDLGFPGWMWSLIFFFPRIFDSITDPIMGYISDNTKSKWGRRRQYVLIGGVLMGIAYIFMWQLFKENSLQFNFWYFFLWSIVFYLGLTLFSVPYVAIGYEMSDDFHERTNIMAIAQWIGQWAWVIAPLFWLIMYDPEWFSSAEEAVRQLAIWVAIPCTICAIVPALFIKTKSTINEDYDPLNFANIGRSLRNIFKSFIAAFKIKEFRKLCISTFLIFNAFNTVASLTFFVIVYKLFNGDTGDAGIWVSLFGCLGALGTTFLVIPIVTWMSKKMGKKKAFIVAQSISVVGYILLYFLFVPGKPWMYIYALPFFSFGIGSLFTIMMSMTADVIDVDELNSGLRREGIFGAIYWWMVKVGFAIAGGLSGAVIDMLGFNPALATTEQVAAVDGLHAFFCFFPMAGTIVAILVMRNYSITEERSKEIRAELDKRKANSPYQNNSEKLLSLSLTNIVVDSTPIIEIKSKDENERKEIFESSLKSKIHGLCFSPYKEGQSINDILTRNQISERIKIISPYTNWVRSFSSTKGNQIIPEEAKKNGLKTMVGAWIGTDKENNERELENLIIQAKKGNVDYATIGNEVLLRNEVDKNELIGYLKRFKKEMPKVPVSYVDTYYDILMNKDIIEYCDFVSINCYPFWEGYTLEDSYLHLKQMFGLIRSIAGNKKVVITETGWPSSGTSVINASPTKTNSMEYFINMVQWCRENKIELFYFSSFDESWKIRHEGDVGSRWGIWDKNDKLKFI